MSEQRFVKDHSYLVNYDKYCILDKVQHKHLYLNEVVGLLNEQQATIDMQELRLQQLEEIIELSENLNKSYREKLIEKIKEIDKLTKENEQLRKQVAEYEMILRQHEFAEQEGFR